MNELHDDNTTTFVRKQGIQSIKFKMWVELSSNFCHLSDIIRPPLRTNSLYEKPTVVFSPHTPCGRVRLACFTLEDHAYGASRLPKRPKTTVCSLLILTEPPSKPRNWRRRQKIAVFQNTNSRFSRTIKILCSTLALYVANIGIDLIIIGVA